MSQKSHSAPIDAIWARMAQNTNVVTGMPEWVKGSPVNQRAAAAGSTSNSGSTQSDSADVCSQDSD